MLVKNFYSRGISFIFAIALIFLQEGFSYYISFQVFALFLILGLIAYSIKTFKDINASLFIILLFSIFLFSQALHEPFIIKRNYTNITLTVAAIIFYASIVVILPNLIIKKPIFLLKVFKLTSALTICSLALLMLLSDLSLFSLSKEMFMLQNANLISNMTDIEAIQANISARALDDNYTPIAHDLFYGEKSYLAIVIFTCIGCYILTSNLILASQAKLKNLKNNFFSFDSNFSFLLISTLCLINLDSLSAIIYVFLIVLFYLSQKISRKINLSRTVPIILFLSITFLAFIDNYEFLLHRINSLGQSLSLTQRYGVLLDYNIYDYFLGLRDVSRMPQEGFHNGILYLISVSGFGGILFLTFLIYKIYFLARPFRMATFLSLLFLAQISQNGGIFGPDKIVLYAMILLPLSCIRSMNFERKAAS